MLNSREGDGCVKARGAAKERTAHRTVRLVSDHLDDLRGNSRLNFVTKTLKFFTPSEGGALETESQGSDESLRMPMNSEGRCRNPICQSIKPSAVEVQKA